MEQLEERVRQAKVHLQQKQWEQEQQQVQAGKDSKNKGRNSRDVAQAQQQLEQVQCALTAARAACSTQQPAIAVQQHVGGQKRRPDYRAMNGGDEENEAQEGSYVISEEKSSSRYNYDCTNNTCFVPNYQAITKF